MYVYKDSFMRNFVTVGAAVTLKHSWETHTHKVMPFFMIFIHESKVTTYSLIQVNRMSDFMLHVEFRSEN